MLVTVVSGTEPDAEVVARAGGLLRQGKLLIYPTDTLYALGARALDAVAVAGVRGTKQREERKPLPVIAADLEQAVGLCARWPEEAGIAAERFWPGPLTLVVPAAIHVPHEVTGRGTTVAVRVPALRLARLLCAEAGPLVATSANRSGAPPPLTCAEAVAAVGRAAAMALDSGPGRPQPSTIVDVSGDQPRLLRAGAVSWEEILDVLG